MDAIQPGVKFDTLAEQGCVVADPPNIEGPYSNRYGTRFHFDAVDSEGICCSFDSRMISRIHLAAGTSCEGEPKPVARPRWSGLDAYPPYAYIDEPWARDGLPDDPSADAAERAISLADHLAAGTEYADQRAHDVFWMTAAERDAHDVAPSAASLASHLAAGIDAILGG